MLFLRKFDPINAVDINACKLQRGVTVMAFEPAVCEPMKAVSHNQQLKAPPSSLSGIEAVSVIDLATELTDDPLDNVGGARHPWMVKVGKEEIHLVLKGEDLPLQPAALKSLSLLLPDPKPEAKLFV